MTSEGKTYLTYIMRYYIMYYNFIKNIYNIQYYLITLIY